MPSQRDSGRSDLLGSCPPPASCAWKGDHQTSGSCTSGSYVEDVIELFRFSPAFLLSQGYKLLEGGFRDSDCDVLLTDMAGALPPLDTAR